MPATRANVDKALATLRETGGGGGTEIVPALKRVGALPKADGLSRSVIVVTDGYVSVETDVFQLIARDLNRHNVFAFGIGSSVNRHLIDGIARAGQAESLRVFRSCPLNTPNDTRSSLQMLAIARAIAVLCA